MSGEAVVAVLFLALVCEIVVTHLLQPVRQRFEEVVDFWWVSYVYLVIGAILGMLSGLNMFPALFPDALTGRIVTAVVIGGGPTLVRAIADAQLARRLACCYRGQTALAFEAGRWMYAMRNSGEGEQARGKTASPPDTKSPANPWGKL